MAEKPAKTAKKSKQKKSYPARFDQVGADDEPAPGKHAIYSCEAVSPTDLMSKPEIFSSVADDQHPKSTTTTTTTTAGHHGAPETTYAQRVAAAFAKFIDLYEYLHRSHEEKASKYPRSTAAGLAERARRADEAVVRVIAFERAAIALIGEHRRRAYAHDLVYGMHKLYELFGKPWNGACEGSEHAHQEVKRFFLKLSCHSKQHAEKHCGVHYQVLRQGVIKQQLCRERADMDLSATEYNAARANTTFTIKQRKKPAGRGGRTKVVNKVVGSKENKYKPTAESRMLVLRDRLEEYM